MAKTKRTIDFKPTHTLFTGWRQLNKFASISVSLGCNPALAREAGGSGVLCVAVPRYKKGQGFAGTSSHAGFVVRLPFQALVRAGFSPSAIYFAEGANLGTRKDHEQQNRPVCEDCILTVGSLRGYKRIHTPTEPCWCCCEMFDDARRIAG